MTMLMKLAHDNDENLANYIDDDELMSSLKIG